MVVVDTFTRYSVLIAIPDETAETACYAFLVVYGMFGTISRIVSDGGPAFISEGWTAFVETLGIHSEITQPHLPSSHGIVEKQHSLLLRTARQVLLDLAELSEANCDRYLPIVQRILNSHETVATGFAPATMLFGSNMVLDQKLLLDIQPLAEREEVPLEYVRVLDDLLLLLRQEGLLVSEDRALDAYEETPATSSHKIFSPGDYVLYANFLSVTGRLGKLSPRFVGPAKVVARLSDDFYTLLDIVQDKNIYAHAKHLIKFNAQGYDENELLDMACSDYMEHTVHYIVGHELHDPALRETRGNLRFTVAFSNDLRGHKGHPGLRWRDLQYVPVFQEYVRTKLKHLANRLPREQSTSRQRPHARAKAHRRLILG
jgi:hypothetical protein